MSDLEEVFGEFCDCSLEIMWEYTHHMNRWNIPYEARMSLPGLGSMVMLESRMPKSAVSSSENHVLHLTSEVYLNVSHCVSKRDEWVLTNMGLSWLKSKGAWMHQKILSELGWDVQMWSACWRFSWQPQGHMKAVCQLWKNRDLALLEK